MPVGCVQSLQGFSAPLKLIVGTPAGQVPDAY